MTDGAYTGKYSFDTFTHKRSSIDSPGWIDMLFGWRYPPYNVSRLSLHTIQRSCSVIYLALSLYSCPFIHKASKLQRSQMVKRGIPAPRPGPGIAPVRKSGWFSWVSRRSPYILAMLLVVLTLRRSASRGGNRFTLLMLHDALRRHFLPRSFHLDHGR